MKIPNLERDPTGRTYLLQLGLKASGFDIVADNWPGAKTTAALGAFQDSLNTAPDGAAAVEGLQMNDWPLERDAEAFYGTRPSLTQIDVAYPMHMDSDKITKITCHVKVVASLRRILAAIAKLYPTPEARAKAGVDVYDGAYADRLVRGSISKRSMHSYGAAIDIDAEHNPLGATTGRMPKEVVAIFKAEGWRWGGDYSGRKDWMHFEACK